MEETPASEIQEIQDGGGTMPPAAAAAPAPEPQRVVAFAPVPPPPPAAAAIPPALATVQVQPEAQAKIMPPEWPCAGYTGPQPWEAENPPALTQNHLMLSSGSAGSEVVELAALLAHLGFGTSISAGENPHAIYDEGVSGAVRAFCAAYGVEEDPAVRQARTQDTVGPWLWEALLRAVHKKLAGTGQLTA